MRELTLLWHHSSIPNVDSRSGQRKLMMPGGDISRIDGSRHSTEDRLVNSPLNYVSSAPSHVFVYCIVQIREHLACEYHATVVRVIEGRSSDWNAMEGIVSSVWGR